MPTPPENSRFREHVAEGPAAERAPCAWRSWLGSLGIAGVTVCSIAQFSACSGHDGGTTPNTDPSKAGDGGVGGRSDASILDMACGNPGATIQCCVNGIATCEGEGEFASWSPCLSSNGKPLMCTYTPSTNCNVGEFGPNCGDGGTANPPTTADGGRFPVGPGRCANGEFSVFCDGGLPSEPGPGSCSLGEFAPDCAPVPAGSPGLCTDPAINNEPEILAGYLPGSGKSVSKNGQIKVWVTDERPAFIAPGEVVDATTGDITTPGDRTGKATDGYLYEPALYIAPASAESGGTPHFPTQIKGIYNNSPQTYTRGGGGGGVVMGAPIDAAPAGVQLTERYNTEFIWDVSSLGLKAGTYIGEFLIHDGDRDRAVGCVSIVITD